MRPVVLLLVALCFFGMLFRFPSPADAASDTPKPGVLIELFTSEGCSSCPPADALLRQLDHTARPDVELIVLSEHVDYWDGQGWRDRFSSSQFTERQNDYVRRLRLDSPYTPQMVVDGTREFVGSAAAALNSALAVAASRPKAELRISLIRDQDGAPNLRIESGSLPSSSRAADLYVAQADNSDETQIGGGENSGRHLYHVAVVRSLRKIGTLRKSTPHFETEIQLKKPAPAGKSRLIVFLQEQGSGRILGAAKLLQ